MANDITNSATFTLGNMKPEHSEVIPALWGQNAADNTGFLYYRDQMLGNVGSITLNEVGVGGAGETTNSTKLSVFGFKKNALEETLVGSLVTWHGHADANRNGTIWVRLYDGKTLIGTIYSEEFNTQTFGNQSFSYDSSSLVDDTYYTVDMHGTFVDTGVVGVQNGSTGVDAFTLYSKRD